MSNKIKFIELFAGVGGFRLGLEGWNGRSATSNYKKEIRSGYTNVWSNQWEPSTRTQHASMIYEAKFGRTNHSNIDIMNVDVSSIPDHDLLVGGFPCQDYSVASTLKNSKGLIGKKGVLWWSIHKIISEKKKKPSYLFLENVDRLLISPAGQRGRDFAIILKSLNDLGYAVEWRVINAADYGMPQRRRRIFILAYRKGTPIYDAIRETTPKDWLLDEGTIAQAFPVTPASSLFTTEFKLHKDLVYISEHFNKNAITEQFENTGLMVKGLVTTLKTTPHYNGKFTVLGDIIQKIDVDPEFYINDHELKKWTYLKGAKKEIRKNDKGFEYHYSEGGMQFPDLLDRPSRTIITGEGGSSASRFKHVIKASNGLRRLTPIELERLNMFPDDHTLLGGISNTKRAFFMGNALVVGVIEKIGLALKKKIYDSSLVQQIE